MQFSCLRNMSQKCLFYIFLYNLQTLAAHEEVYKKCQRLIMTFLIFFYKLDVGQGYHQHQSGFGRFGCFLLSPSLA